MGCPLLGSLVEKIMKVYYVHGSTGYGCGLAVVIAKSQKQAKALLIASDEYGFRDPQYGLEITSVTAIRGVTVTRKKAAIITSFAYIE